MILDRNKSKDEDGNPVWQVRAALDGDEVIKRKEKPQPAPVIQNGDQPDFDHRLQYSVQHLEYLIGGLGRRETDTLRSTLNTEAERRAFDTLLNCTVSPTYAHDLAPGIAEHAQARATCLRWGKRLRPKEQPERVLITGPCGGGKTTMIADLATHFHMQGIKVALVSSDTERMGGIEGLEAYASVLGIELHAMRKAEDARNILHKKESARLLLIDSEGWSQAKRKSYRRQAPLWQALTPNRRMLLLPANLDEADGMATLEASAGLHLTDLLPGKLDETSATGKVVNWAARSRLPLSYCSFGSCVPDQMGWLNPGTLATLLLRNNGTASA